MPHWQRSKTPTLPLFADEKDFVASPVDYNVDDSDIEEEEKPGLFASNGSLCSLSAFPLPPATAPIAPTAHTPLRRLFQARSLSNMSTKYHEQNHARAVPAPPQQQQQQQQHTLEPPTRRSPLRERRCKKPLTIKAPLPPSRMPIRRTRSSSSMMYTPPPCPPPSTPLPDLPLHSGNSLSRRTPEGPLDRSQILDEEERSSFDVESSGEWMNKVDRSISPTPSSTSSISSTPSTGSRSSSSQRRYNRKVFSSTPPTSDDRSTCTRPDKSFNWSEQLSLKLGHAFALHLSSAPAPIAHHSEQAYNVQDTEQSAPPNELHVYGFAM